MQRILFTVARRQLCKIPLARQVKHAKRIHTVAQYMPPYLYPDIPYLSVSCKLVLPPMRSCVVFLAFLIFMIGTLTLQCLFRTQKAFIGSNAQSAAHTCMNCESRILPRLACQCIVMAAVLPEDRCSICPTGKLHLGSELESITCTLLGSSPRMQCSLFRSTIYAFNPQRWLAWAEVGPVELSCRRGNLALLCGSSCF